MEHHGPRDQGRPPGRKSSYGAKHLSDAEDSVVIRKKALHPQNRGRNDRTFSREDHHSIEEYSEDDRPADDYDDDDDSGLGGRLARRDSKGRRSKKWDPKNLGPNFPYDDHDEMDVNDLGKLKMHHDIRSEEVKHARTPAEREFLANAVEMINEDIARLEYKERQRTQVGFMGSNSRQNRAGGRRGSQDFLHESRKPHSDRFELSQLEKDLQSEIQNVSRFAESGDSFGLQMAEANVEKLSEIVERLQFESRQGDKMSRGMGGPTRGGDREGYSENESEYQRRGSRRDYSDNEGFRMRFDVNEANMAALNRSFGNMGMGSRRSSNRVGSQSRRGLGSRRLDDGDGYDEEYINRRKSSIREEPRRRRGIDSRHLDDMDGFNEEDVDLRRPSTRVLSRKKQDTGLEYMDRPIPSNFPHALGGSHRSRSQTTNPQLPLAELLAELDKAQEEKEKGEKAMLWSLKNSVAYNEGLEQRDQAKLRIEQVTEEIYKHDPDQDDMDTAQRIAMHLPSKSDRNHEVGGSSRSRRGPTANRAGEHGRKGHTSGRGGGQGIRHGHGGHGEHPKRLEFY